MIKEKNEIKKLQKGKMGREREREREKRKKLGIYVYNDKPSMNLFH